ncbi:type II secretion system F family protein [Arthrobacter woluwensis]|uniref:Type II secretion system (T2SS), protein F n=1 Tax=Arthrobacter woluwensis TaxID=156980 RepID=A0A1H4LBN1_9MICC|nr:type II secretion system F family protein [Arthrobacter woluwensis]SEB68151.1 Type II secretion system (T2SS), protein F [Arthrobacter woluwensis]
MILLQFSVLLFACWCLTSARPSCASVLLRRGAGDAQSHDGPEGRPEASGGPGVVEDSALLLELVGVLLESGLSLERSLEVLAECADQVIAAQLRRVVAALALGAAWDEAWRSASDVGLAAGVTGDRVGLVSRAVRLFRGAGHGLHPSLQALKRTLRFAALSGAPSAQSIRSSAAAERRRTLRESERRAAALGVRLVLPLGMCSLPSFICLGIIPVVLALLPGVV